MSANSAAVVVVDLNFAGMTKAPKPVPDGAVGHARSGRRAKAGLSRAVLDVSPAELRRQLFYKLAWHGGALLVADRFYPSSKDCSSGRTVTASSQGEPS